VDTATRLYSSFKEMAMNLQQSPDAHNYDAMPVMQLLHNSSSGANTLLR